MARNVARWAGDAELRAIEVLDPKVLRDDVEPLLGHRFSAVLRRGKYLVARQKDVALVLHFRMTGKVVRDLADPQRAGVIRKSRLTLDFGDHQVHFVDTRRLGEAWVVPTATLDAFYAQHKLGPEFFEAQRDGAWWQSRFARRRGPIKPALLRQDAVAGIGNILATEACFRAQLDPARSVREVSAEDFARIDAALHALIRETLVRDAGDEIAYVSGGTTEWTDVYGREGLPCPVCKAPIARMVQAGRSTYWCPVCQRP